MDQEERSLFLDVGWGRIGMKDLELCVGSHANSFKVPSAYAWKQFWSKYRVMKLTEVGASRLPEKIMLKLDNIGNLNNWLVVIILGCLA